MKKKGEKSNSKSDSSEKPTPKNPQFVSFLKRRYYAVNELFEEGKMSFTDYIYAIIQNTKSSLQIGLNAFLDMLAERNCSIYAFPMGSCAPNAAVWNTIPSMVITPTSAVPADTRPP